MGNLTQFAGRRKQAWLAGLLLVAGLCAPGAVAQTQEPEHAPVAPVQETPFEEVEVPELEELLETEINSLGRKKQKLFNTPAAAYVITDEDIQRLGAQSIPEALRIVPGMHIGQISRSRWSVSSRGLLGEYNNNLLVLQDGRMLYDPAFGGTVWDMHDTILEDVSRIEVIRGPGGSLWGANGTNGIISIQTKTAWDTQGWLIKGGYGTEDNGWGQVRYGDTLSDDAAFRVYAKWFDRDGFVDPMGDDTHDDWDAFRAGFRMDWDIDKDNMLTVQGDYFSGHAEATSVLGQLTPPYQSVRDGTTHISSADILARWTRDLGPGSELQLQVYYDHVTRSLEVFEQDRNTVDMDFQHSLRVGDRHSFIWGLGYRATWDDLTGSVLSFDPGKRLVNVYSTFAQFTAELAENERLTLELGSKFEFNDHSGFEIQPSARLAWKPNEDHTVWAAITRAVRTPSRADHDIRFELGVVPPAGPVPPVLIVLDGNGKLRSQEVIAFELGYRVRPTSSLTLDATAFYNIYDDLPSYSQISNELVLSPTGPFVISSVSATNGQKGEFFGAELAFRWTVTPCWRLAGSYSFLQGNLQETANIESVPAHQFNLRSYWDITDSLQLDTSIYYVDNISAVNSPSYIRWDAQVTWHPTEFMSLAVGVQNILDSQHFEMPSEFGTPPVEIERMGYVTLEFRF
jgi:iron complex outermembrane receptor protein